MPGKRVTIFGWSDSVHVQRWVSGLAARGYEFQVVSLGGTKPADVPTIQLPRRGKLSYVWQAPFAANIARSYRPDLVHVHSAAGFGLWGLWAGIKPLLISVWGSDLTGYRPRRLYRIFSRHLLKTAGHVTATSRFLKDRIGEICPPALDRVSHIPFGVVVPKDAEPAPAGPLKICYLKAHRRIYGPHILLEAMAQVKRAVPEATLTMAGQGRMTGKLRQMGAALGLGDCVRFPGFIAPDSVYDFIRQHHLMVMPSLSEAFGVAALEAAACARPVIASNVGGIPEVVQNEVTGLLVTPHDATGLAEGIIRLAGDAKTRDRMGRAGHEFVKEHYPWEKSLDAMDLIYRRLING